MTPEIFEDDPLPDPLPPDGFLVRESSGRVYFVDGFGRAVENIHAPEKCAGRSCVIHNQSEHRMRGMTLSWRQADAFDIKPSHFERICSHGIGHPDPDSSDFLRSTGQSVDVHGCDGCCGLHRSGVLS